MLFMSMEGDYISELRPPTGLLLISQVKYGHEELLWNYIDSRKPKNSFNLLQSHFVHHKSHMDWPQLKPRPPLWEAVN
jgi:hypothetical protein